LIAALEQGITWLSAGNTMTTTITQKGQVTVPKAIRDRMRLEPGAKVEFVLNERGEVVLKRVDAKKPRAKFSWAKGVAGPGLTTAEIMKLTRGEE
jgi:antitoxin PrlF